MTPDPSLTNLPALLLAALLAACLWADVRRDLRRLVSGRNVVLLAIAAWYLLEALSPSAEVLRYSQDAYNYGIFCVALALCAFLAVYHCATNFSPFDPLARKLRLLDDPRLLRRFVFLCAAIGLAPIAYYSGLHLYDLFRGIFGMRQTWGGLVGRGRYGDLRGALLVLEYFALGVGPFAAIVLLDRRNHLLHRLPAAFIALWPLFRAFGSGTRTAMITALLPMLAIVYLKLSPKNQRRAILASIAATPLIYAFMASLAASRGSGEFSWDPAAATAGVGNEMFQELVFITTQVPENVDYQLGYSYYAQLVNPIPRFLWPAKPAVDAGILMAQLKGEVHHQTGVTYLTRSPGIIGEMYLNFGLPGVLLLSAFGGCLVRSWDRIPKLHAASLPTMVFYFAGLAVLFIMGRSFTANMFYGLLFVAAALYFLALFATVPPARPSSVRAHRTAPRPPSL